MSFNAKAVWLRMLRDGGRWSAAEIAQRFDILPNEAANGLRSMAEHETVKRFGKAPEHARKQGDRVSFGVTATCRIPRGLVLSDLLESKILPGADE